MEVQTYEKNSTDVPMHDLIYELVCFHEGITPFRTKGS